MDQADGRSVSREEREMSKTEGLASPQVSERIDIQDNENDSGKPVLSPIRFVVVFIAFSVSFTLIALDQTILSTALATIASDFDAVSDLTWIASAYFLPQAGLMLLFGRMLSIFWPKIIYLISIVLFELGSLVCAVAPSANVLIFGRAFAGVGAAGLWVSVMSIFAHISTLRQRPLLLGVMGAIFAICSVAGPIVGGALTEQVTWRWCFWLNLPCGGLALLLVFVFLPNIPPTDNTSSSARVKWLQLDYIGAFLSVAMVTLLLIPLQWGGNVKPWNDASVIALLVVAAVLVVLFIAWEYRQQSNAILPLTMALSGSMPGACLEAFFVNMCFTITTYYLPLFYQVKGHSPTHSGIDILPFMISGVLMSFASGGVVSSLGYVWPFLFGSPFLAAIAGGLLFTVGLDTSTSKLIGYQILLGAGLGAVTQNPIVVAQAQYQKSPDLVSQATSLVTFMQLLGSSIGLAISSAVLSGQLVRQLNDVRPALPENVKDAVRESVSVIFTLPEGIRVPVMDAYVDAVKSVFLILVGAAAMCSLSSLLISRQRVNVKPGAL